MKKLIISKKLAEAISLNGYNIKDSLYEIKGSHTDELEKLQKENGFRTTHQVVAYLLGGQEAVYEVEKTLYTVTFKYLGEQQLKGLKEYAQYNNLITITEEIK